MERLELSRELARDILRRAGAKGASAGDVAMLESDSFSVTVRLGDVEKISHAKEKRLGLRVFFGRRSATSSTSDVSSDAIERMVEAACVMARSTAEDPFGGLPEPTELARSIPDLDLADGGARELSVVEKIRLVTAAEKAALDYDSRIFNSEGAEFSHESSRMIYASTLDFAGEYETAMANLSVIAVARENGSMQRDYWYSTQRKLARLQPAATIGETAARRALRRLGARKARTAEVPVVFDSECAAGLLRHLATALSGYSLYKGASFLVGKRSEKIAADSVTVIDDGTIPGALGSKPFDGEGAPTRKKIVVERGILRDYLLDSYSGRKLGYPSTGNASRSAGDSPTVAPTNFYLAPGALSPDEIVASVEAGFYVTELIGFGVNLVTGDYSRGAAGLWIEKGKLTYPVEEVTIAGNLNEMLKNIEMVGNDLELRGRVAAPTLKISRMIVAGD